MVNNHWLVIWNMFYLSLNHRWLPGLVNIQKTIENGHRHSRFTHENPGDFPISDVNVYQRVCIFSECYDWWNDHPLSKLISTLNYINRYLEAGFEHGWFCPSWESSLTKSMIFGGLMLPQCAPVIPSIRRCRNSPSF